MTNVKATRRSIRNGIVALSFLLLSSFVAAQTTGANWPLAHFNSARTNFNPSELLLGPGNVGGLTELWSFSRCGNAARAMEAAAVANGIAYVTVECRAGMYTYTATLYALNARTGAMVWERPLGIGRPLCDATYPPGVASGVVYVGWCDGMSALDAATGALLWQNTTIGPVLDLTLQGNGVAVANGMVYFATLDKVYALNAATGTVVWSFTPQFEAQISPAVAGSVVYVTNGDGLLSALDGATGAMLWSARIGAGGVQSPPTVANGVLYVSTIFADGLYAFDAQTGTFLWSTNALGFQDVSATAGVAYGRVYFTYEVHDQGPRSTFAINPQTGSVIWQTPNIGGETAIAIANGVVYAVNRPDAKVYALDAGSGRVISSFGLAGSPSSVVVVKGMVYVTTYTGELHVFGLAH